jgi:hypothetical protein
MGIALSAGREVSPSIYIAESFKRHGPKMPIPLPSFPDIFKQSFEVIP